MNQTAIDFTENIYHQEKIKNSLNNFRFSLGDLNSRLLTGKSSYSYGTKIIQAGPADIVRVLSDMPTKNALDCTVKNIVLNSVYSAEKTSPGSGFVLSCMLSNDVTGICNPDYSRCTVEYLEKAVDSYLDLDSITSKLSKGIVRVSGPGRSVFFKETKFNKFLIKKHSGKILRAEIHEIFKQKISSIEDCLLVFIDGILESVGEIDFLLRQLNEQKTPCVIMARGFSGDVAKTLDENYSRGLLKAIPVVYTLGNSEDIFKICEELQIKYFSSIKNNDIRKIEISELDQIKRVIFENGLVSILAGQGNDTQIEIMIPENYKKLSGIIKDRVKFGKLLAESCMISGVVSMQIKKEDFYTSRLCLEAANKIYQTLIKNLKDLRCVVIT